MTTIWIIGVGLVCFIAGMVLELIINARELNATRDELEHVKSELHKSRLQTVEVIEIHDTTVLDSENDSLFAPW